MNLCHVGGKMEVYSILEERKKKESKQKVSKFALAKQVLLQQIINSGAVLMAYCSAMLMYGAFVCVFRGAAAWMQAVR